MKINKSGVQRKKIAGNILLPLFGWVYWFPLMMIIFLVLFACAAWVGKHTHPLFGLLVGIVIWFVGGGIISLAAAIVAEGLEQLAMNIGLGAEQYWYGSCLREKICREVFRGLTFIGSFAVAGILAWYIYNHVPLRANDQGTYFLIAMIFGATWQIGLVALTILVALIKVPFPSFGGFKGDPKWRYPHIF